MLAHPPDVGAVEFVQHGVRRRRKDLFLLVRKAVFLLAGHLTGIATDAEGYINQHGFLCDHGILPVGY